MSIETPIQGRIIGRGVFHAGQSATSANSVAYIPIGDMAATYSNGTEGVTDYPVQFNCYITRVQALIPANTKGGDVVLAFRAGGASVGALTVTAGATTDKDSGAISVYVAAGTKINFMRDSSAGASGSISFNIFAEYVVVG